MSPLQPISASQGQSVDRKFSQKPLFITGFQSISPRFRSSQKKHFDWLVDAHVVLGKADRKRMRAMFSHIRGAADHIAFRGHELQDFSHRRWRAMRLFSPKGSGITEKTQFFDETVATVFERLYPNDAAAPGSIVHVTCTGYSAPSAAQRLVSTRGWGRITQVIHAYHMGCYAAHPALRIAAGQRALGPIPVDVVHTELCSLHLDPARHDLAQLVIQSLFADGHIKYQLVGGPPEEEASLEVLALHDEIIPDSTGAMNWTPGPVIFSMALSKEVPTLLATALPGFAVRLCDQAGLDYEAEKAKAVFAVHPGGPRIIELSQRILALREDQIAASRQVLRLYGNMSSATLPHIWDQILRDETIPIGTLIVSLGAGPGLTLSGGLFRKS